MQELVKEKIKNPDIKRRHSFTIAPKEIKDEQKQDDPLPSCFGDDVSFNEYHAQKEEER